MKLKLIILLLAMLSFTVHAQQNTNAKSQGNLKSNYQLACIKKNKLKNIYTPADLFPAVAKCIKKGEYSLAVYLAMVTNAYGHYDAARVEDESAAQAFQVLQLRNLGGLKPGKTKKFLEEFRKFNASEKNKSDACQLLSKLGKPDYHPHYMIQHGLKSVTGIEGDGLIAGYDASAIWQDTMTNYINCAG